MCFSVSACKIRRSSCVIPTDASTTSTAMSVWENVCFARCTRNSPSAPLSSRPGVSMSTTGPMGSSSIAFSTVSVVVPRMSETTDTCCPVTALIRLDLPALRLPKNPM